MSVPAIIQEDGMQKVIDKGQFLDMFKGRAVLVTSVASGRNQDLANQVNETEGRGDAALRTKAEFSALFDLLTRQFDADRSNNGLALLGGDGRPTAAGQAVEGFLKASEGKDEFFEEEMYLVRVTDWPREKLLPDEPVEASGNARLPYGRPILETRGISRHQTNAASVFYRRPSL
jgi:hypothetical protein